jgi:hydrogenase maturation protease
LVPTLILGYGNVDRQDDGVAWHVMLGLENRLGRSGPFNLEDGFPPSDSLPALIFVLQLTPELAETVAQYQRVCFVDAHTGNVEASIQLVEVDNEFQASPLTHHLTPSSCLALSKTLYQGNGKAVLLSIRGYEFGFSRLLSTKTEKLVQPAVEMIWGWLYAEN